MTSSVVCDDLSHDPDSEDDDEDSEAKSTDLICQDSTTVPDSPRVSLPLSPVSHVLIAKQ